MGKRKTEALGHMEDHLRETTNIHDKDKDLDSNRARWQQEGQSGKGVPQGSYLEENKLKFRYSAPRPAPTQSCDLCLTAT